jgi:hypothetical protein
MDIKQAQDILALAALCDDPVAKAVFHRIAAVALLDDSAAGRNAQQAIALALTASAAGSMQGSLQEGQQGELRDVSIERDGALVARFIGGRAQTIDRFGGRLLASSADAINPAAEND